MPLSGAENWTLALSWNMKFGSLGAIVHGLYNDEVPNFVTYHGDSREELIHLMTVPTVLCEMLAESDSNGIKRRATELYQIEIRTNYHGYPRNDALNVCIHS
jgi:hypothetical protein